eukprot:m.335480 g.335480  ORF g.335480 m.335480 type:complete len:109 (+) comp17605_c0_seq1:180-506(+)
MLTTERFAVFEKPSLPSSKESSRRNSLSSDRAISMDEVRNHCMFGDCWIVVDDTVFDISEFLLSHPGGEEILLEHAGSNATHAFYSMGHSQHAMSMLKRFVIGKLLQE